jgi:4-hydroxythreonine-4-phosphate dehydrogenase
MKRPVVAITMGDPAGIGPELIVKVLAQQGAYRHCRPFVVGDPQVMREICDVVGTNLTFQPIEALSQARFAFPEVDVLRPEGLRLQHVEWGQLDPAMGEAAALCLKKAIELAMAGQVQGVVSAPLNKEAFHMAGYDYLDELAYMADLTGSADTYIMGVMDDRVWTVSITEHIPFREIVPAIRRERIAGLVGKMSGVLHKAGLSAPRIAVAALNVHGGEGGLFGREEIEEIGPAIQDAQARGIDARGPIPADTVFVRALAGEFDGVVCMYHDQANIARKLQPTSKRVTLFMGLPVVCGTTAHGTAFDKAGQGIADPGSLAAALKYAVMLSAGGRGFR